MLKIITNENFFLYCAQAYNNPQCSTIEEFYEDLKRIKYLKKLFTRYEKTGELKERLILNHIITLANVFGPEHTTRILFFKMQGQWEILAPFLNFLNILPELVTGLGKGEYVVTSEIMPDATIVGALSKI